MVTNQIAQDAVAVSPEVPAEVEDEVPALVLRFNRANLLAAADSDDEDFVSDGEDGDFLENHEDNSDAEEN